MPAPGDIYVITSRGSAFGQTVLGTYHYSITTITGTPTELQVATEFLTQVRGGPGGVGQLENTLLPMMPPDYTLNEWWAQKIEPVRFRKAIYGRNVVGTHASSTEANNQAAVLTRVCEFAGRPFVGGLHVGPIPQAATVQDNGLVAAAYNTLLQNHAVKVVLPINGTIAATFTAVPILYHRTTHNGTPITAAFPQSSLRVMRRRTLFLGK